MKTNVYFKGILVFTFLRKSTFREMLARGWIVERAVGGYDLVENEEYRFFFKGFPKKMARYLKAIGAVDFTCTDCNKKMSMHIRPAVLPDGTINFKEIVCVCNKCRKKKLQKEDILIPQFRKDLTRYGVRTQVVKEIKKKHSPEMKELLLTDKKYMYLRVEQEILYSMTKIVLPPLRREGATDLVVLQNFLKAAGIDSVEDELDLKERKNRILIREFLSLESRSHCPCCGKKVIGYKYTIDHIHPKSEGGPNNIKNFIGLCYNCNQEKDSMTVLRFLQFKHFIRIPERVLVAAYEEKERVKVYYKETQEQVKAIEEEKQIIIHRIKEEKELEQGV